LLEQEKYWRLSKDFKKGKFCFFKLSRILSPNGFLDSNIANACIGISGRVVACIAGDKSSVFVSPSTLNTKQVISFSRTFLFLNHSAFAQLFITSFA